MQHAGAAAEATPVAEDLVGLREDELLADVIAKLACERIRLPCAAKLPRLAAVIGRQANHSCCCLVEDGADETMNRSHERATHDAIIIFRKLYLTASLLNC